MSKCEDCVNFVSLTATTGECHFAPPVPNGSYPSGHSQWPVVHPVNDECSQFSAGAHPGTTCSACANYSVLPFTDPGACNNPDKPEQGEDICADAECLGIPPTPAGEFRGDRSLWPRVKDDDPSCSECFV